MQVLFPCEFCLVVGNDVIGRKVFDMLLLVLDFSDVNGYSDSLSGVRRCGLV